MREGARLLLVRHGHTDWLVPPANRLAGRLPGISLNARGRAEAAALAERLATAPPDRIVASPLERTVETATIIGQRVDRPVITDERIIETAMGPWEGLAVSEIMARAPEAWRTWRTVPTRMTLPGMEPVEAIGDRMWRAAREYVAVEGTTLLVSHQDPLLALICRLLDLPLDAMRRMDLSPGSLTVFEVTGRRPVLVTLNSLSGEALLRQGAAP
ncbi:MAG: histidine phosphatase family protein [Armatimonadota bacterium]|nr:histidine phosphatase family protein [Armatimonadota bacterium]MDR7518629.1 histidine phosphatase family protein [Armatimonadota bacterium]MDR7550750.1 histidine phosphatase family protein [Armatimonadota bacterium]